MESGVAFVVMGFGGCQCPLSSDPRRVANQAPESKRGKQHQSTEPTRLTSATVWRSPISP